MKPDLSKHIFTGMSKDLAQDKFSDKTYLDAKNIRITATDNNTMLAVTNEQGNKQLTLSNAIQGTCIGHAVINNTIVVFTTETALPSNIDRIYTIVINNTNNATVTEKFSGNLNFSVSHKLETLVSFENIDSQKIYWVDGRNQPRVINIASTILQNDNTQFDFSRELTLTETVQIQRFDLGGTFMPGTIQYFMTYFNMYGQESSIFYQSQLMYTSESNAGGEPNKTVSNSFNLTVSNIDTKWDYVRLYCVQRTSTDTNATARIVGEAEASNESLYATVNSLGRFTIDSTVTEITWSPSATTLLGSWTIDFESEDNDKWIANDSNCQIKIPLSNDAYLFINVHTGDYVSHNDIPEAVMWTDWKVHNMSNHTMFVYKHDDSQLVISFIDDGIHGELIDQSILSFISAENIKASTLEQKDNVLFLGNLEINHTTFSSDIKNAFKLAAISESTETKPYTTSLTANEYYRYDTQLKFPASISSKSTSCFKWNETYRFGVQFQDKYGKWSQPLFIKDHTIATAPVVDGTNIIVSKPRFTLSQSLYNQISSYGFKKMRPIVVIPSYTEREVICQGVLCPTVYNVNQRFNNAPFAQPSWFFRPINKVSYYTCTRDSQEDNKCEWDGTYKYFNDASKVNGTCVEFRNGGRIPGKTSLRGEIMTSAGDFTLPTINPLQDRHGYYVDPVSISNDYASFIDNNSEEYFVDTSIITLNSPDIEFDDQILATNLNNSKFRIVGACNIASNTGDISIHTTDNPNAGNRIFGFKKHVVKSHNTSKILTNGAYYFDSVYSTESGRTINNKMGYIMYPFYKSNRISNNPDDTAVPGSVKTKLISNFRYSSISKYISTPHNINAIDIKVFDNASKAWSAIQYAGKTCTYSSVEQDSLHSKTMRNLFTYCGTNDSADVNALIDNPISYGDQSYPCIGIYRASIVKPDAHTPILDMTIQVVVADQGLTSSKFHLIRMPNGDSGRSMSINVNTLTVNESHESGTNYSTYTCVFEYEATTGRSGSYSWIDLLFYVETSNLSRTYTSLYTNTAAGSYHADNNTWTMRTQHKPSIRVTYSKDESGQGSEVICGSINDPTVFNTNLYTYPYLAESTVNAADQTFLMTVPVQYKSTRHAVISFDRYLNNGKYYQYALPEYIDEIQQSLFNLDVNDDTKRMFFDTDHTMIHTFDYNSNNNINIFGHNVCDKLLIGELYRDVPNKFGGTSNYAIENNNWIVAGNAVNVAVNAYVDYTEGDTYFQRYDCLKTLPRNLDDVNQIIDICSFMVESRINIDGIFGNRRNVDDILSITENNFNLLNKGYTQNDNFFTYNILDDRFKINKFPNQITWTQRKVFGAKTDNWTNVTLVNTLDLDGNKGLLTRLERFTNDIWFFQERGFGKIGFNEHVQISADNGMPIELANSGTVTGKVYASEQLGSQNKWSIINTKNGLYFADNINKAIIKLTSDGTHVITDELGMSSWAKNTDLNSIVSFYDAANHDVYFKLSNESLTYNELMGQFISFYDYSDAAMFNINSMFVSLHNVTQSGTNYVHAYLNHEGNFNQFYGTYMPYWIEFIENKDPEIDKIFTNIEYRADMQRLSSGQNPQWTYVGADTDTFNTITTDDEYQVVNDTAVSNQFSAIHRKFRVWRVQIGRNVEDRVRNTWCKIKLLRTMSQDNDDNNHKHILYDAIVKHYS